MRVLNAPAAPADGDVAAAPAERLTPAYASADNRLPDYPPIALKAGCRSGTVAVRVHIDREGNVSAQRDVPGHPLPADDCHMAFRASVQSAINSWRFAPAFRQTPVADPAAEARAPVVHWKQEPIAIYLDFEFTFDVVAGKGVVRSR
jgi:outer membrane biosynthesis protein TonB